MLPINEFLYGTRVTPRPLRADAYTIGSGDHVSADARERSLYHVVPRRGQSGLHPFAKDDRMVFLGLRRILRDLLVEPVTMAEIEETDRFLSTFHAGGTPFTWDRDMWVRCVKEYGGRPPILIEAFLEGTTAFPYEPVMQITSAHGFGEMAAWFESKLLQVWAPSERATTLRWWHEYLKDKCRECHPSWPEGQVSFVTSLMCHDFGDRAGSCEMESEVLGSAHLMVMPGTDTVAGAYQDWANNGEKPYGCSIHALAHRIVQAFGRERDCHAALYKMGRDGCGITAHVSDTYDFFNTVDLFVEKMLPDNEWGQDENVVVFRPDSGDPWECINYVQQTAKIHGLVTADPDTGLLSATRAKWIEGDSMTFPQMQDIIDKCIENGFSPFGFGAFGVGGALRNGLARDHSGLSMKLAACGHNLRPVVKRSHTTAKSSIPGNVVVLDGTGGPTVYPSGSMADSPRLNLLTTWYDGLSHQPFLHPCLDDNGEVRYRVQNHFLDRVQPEQVLSDEIIAERDRLFEEGGW